MIMMLLQQLILHHRIRMEVAAVANRNQRGYHALVNSGDLNTIINQIKTVLALAK
jgi:hypothetical protein